MDNPLKAQSRKLFRAECATKLRLFVDKKEQIYVGSQSFLPEDMADEVEKETDPGKEFLDGYIQRIRALYMDQYSCSNIFGELTKPAIIRRNEDFANIFLDLFIQMQSRDLDQEPVLPHPSDDAQAGDLSL